MLVFSGMKSTSMSSGLAKKFSTSGGGWITCVSFAVLKNYLYLYYSVIEITEKILDEVTKNRDMF